MTERDDSGATAEEHRLAAGRRIMERIRAEANEEYGYFQGDEGEDVFCSLYLTPRDTSIPEHLLKDDLLLGIHSDIRQLFFQVYDGIRAELLQRFGRERGTWLVVDPSVDDHSTTVICADGTVLLLDSTKAWNFWWEDGAAMASDLGKWYENAAARFPSAGRQGHNYNYGTERT